MFEDPKWKPIYIKRQWHKRRRRIRRKEQMTFNNKQELIDKIKEKQASAKRDLESLPRRRTINSEKLVSTIRAYEYVIDLIDSAKIVVYPEETGKAPTTRNDELDALQYAVEGLNKNRNLVKAYFGATIKIHTKKRIVGSTTPFESTGKVVVDSGKYVSIKEEDGRYSTIDKADIESIEIISPERETLFVDPLKVSDKGCVEENDIKTLFEKAPITPYIEPKVEPLRHDRFREFKRTNDDKTTTTVTIDSKEISTMVIQQIQNDTYDVVMVGNGGMLFYKRFIEEPRAKAYYEELVEWWKYWKQM